MIGGAPSRRGPRGAGVTWGTGSQDATQSFDRVNLTALLHPCRSCAQELPEGAYYWQDKYRDPVCRACRRARARSRSVRLGASSARPHVGGLTVDQRTAMAALIKAALRCKVCRTDNRLEFDHLPEFEKRFTISEALRNPARYSDAEVLAEIAKCEVVCRDCHQARTAIRKRLGVVVPRVTGEGQ